jgi:broad specificity phosphatase PhoE
MTRIYLIRHGQSVQGFGPGDPPLSAEGQRQAQATAAHLLALPIAHVYASPLRRALETAAPIAAARGLPIIEDLRLRERMNWGDVPDQSREDFVALWERCTRERTYAPPQGISAWEAGERLADFLQAMSERHPGEIVAAATHGGTITDFLLNRFSIDELARVQPEIRRLQGDLLANCSITRVRCRDRLFEIEAIAEHGHLICSTP